MVEGEKKAEEATAKLEPVMDKAVDCMNRFVARAAKIIEPYAQEQQAKAEAAGEELSAKAEAAAGEVEKAAEEAGVELPEAPAAAFVQKRLRKN